MSMQIGSLMRSLLGELQPADAKTLDLKVGQIVKGMVLQLLGEQDALVNIGGVHVRARLEAPLQQGQVTFLQVQPESNGGQMVLKPVNGTDVPLTDDTLADMLKGFGMKDQPAVRELARQLQQADVALTKGSLQSFQRVMEQAPPDAAPDQWLEAALVAHKRQLPLTRETVRSLREAMFGPPLHAQLDRLEAEAAAAARAPMPQAASGELRELLGKLAQAMRAVRDAAGAMPAPGATAPAAPGSAAGAAAAASPAASAPAEPPAPAS
ncbi:hypothetical protein DLM86_12000, partial [Paenibacillus flagellatus]